MIKAAVAAGCVCLATLLLNGVLLEVRDSRLSDANDQLSVFKRQIDQCHECSSDAIRDIRRALSQSARDAEKCLGQRNAEMPKEVSLLIKTRAESKRLEAAEMGEKFDAAITNVFRLKKELASAQGGAWKLEGSFDNESVRAAIRESEEIGKDFEAIRSVLLGVAGGRFSLPSQCLQAKLNADKACSNLTKRILTSAAIMKTRDLIGECIKATNNIEKLRQEISSAEKEAKECEASINGMVMASANEIKEACSNELQSKLSSYMAATNAAQAAFEKHRKRVDAAVKDATASVGSKMREVDALVVAHGSYADNLRKEANGFSNDLSRLTRDVRTGTEKRGKEVASRISRVEDAIKALQKKKGEIANEAAKIDEKDVEALLKMFESAQAFLQQSYVDEIDGVSKGFESESEVVESNCVALVADFAKCVDRAQNALPNFDEVAKSMDAERVLLLGRCNALGSNMLHVASDVSQLRDTRESKAVQKGFSEKIERMMKTNDCIRTTIESKGCLACRNGAQADEMRDWLASVEAALTLAEREAAGYRDSLAKSKELGDLCKVEVLMSYPGYWAECLKNGNTRFEIGLDMEAGDGVVEVEAIVRKNERKPEGSGVSAGLCSRVGGGLVKQVTVRGALYDLNGTCLKRGSERLFSNFMRDQVSSVVVLRGNFSSGRNYFILDLDLEVDNGKSFRNSSDLSWNWDKLSFNVKVNGKPTTVYHVEKHAYGGLK